LTFVYELFVVLQLEFDSFHNFIGLSVLNITSWVITATLNTVAEKPAA